MSLPTPRRGPLAAWGPPFAGRPPGRLRRCRGAIRRPFQNQRSSWLPLPKLSRRREYRFAAKNAITNNDVSGVTLSTKLLTDGREHMVGNLRPRRDPDVVAPDDRFGHGLVSPRSCWSAVDMSVRGDIDHQRLVRRERMRQEILKDLDELPRRSAVAHGVRQVVDLHGERDCRDPALLQHLDIGTVVVKSVALP